jgi:hypothetical protein
MTVDPCIVPSRSPGPGVTPSKVAGESRCGRVRDTGRESRASRPLKGRLKSDESL